jgi:hypothetical protein
MRPDSTKVMKMTMVVVVLFAALFALDGAQARIEDDAAPAAMLADSQLQALYDLYQATGGPNWINNSGWASRNDDPCGRSAGNRPWCVPPLRRRLRLVRSLAYSAACACACAVCAGMA